MSGGYYLTAEPVGVCSCHDCNCPGCPECMPDADEIARMDAYVADAESREQ